MTQMSHTDPATPTVNLGGKSWPIPELAPRQLRHARRLIIDVTKAIEPKTEPNAPADEAAALQEREACLRIALELNRDDVAAAIGARSERPVPPKIVQTTGDQLISMSSEDFGKMCDAVYYGLTRAHPDLTRDAFDDMPVTDAEMYLAFLIVRHQSQVYASLQRQGPKSGEAKAMESQTGTS